MATGIFSHRLTPVSHVHAGEEAANSLDAAALPADRYSTSHAAVFGVRGEQTQMGKTHGAYFYGERDQLIAAGLAEAADFPEFARIGSWRRDEFNNLLYVQREGEAWRLVVMFRPEFVAWREAQVRGANAVGAMPASEDTYRARLLAHAGQLLTGSLWSDLEQTSGGYRLQLDHDEFADAVANVLSVIEGGSVRFSKAARDMEVRAHEAEATRLDPRCQRLDLRFDTCPWGIVYG